MVVALAALGLWSWRHDRQWMAFVLVFALSAPLGRVDRQSLEADLPDADPDLVGRAVHPRRLGGTAVLAAARLRRRPRPPHRVRRLRSQELLLPARQGGLGSGGGLRGPRFAAGDTIVFSVGFLHIPFDHYYTAPAGYSVHEVELTGNLEDVFVRAKKPRRAAACG